MTTTMYDSIVVSHLPANASAVAGYVDGRWRTFLELARAFPHARRLSIATSASSNATCLDVERFDASPAQAPAWVRKQWSRGVHRPVLYAALSTVPALTRELALAHVPLARVRIWSAHWTERPHRCGPRCGLSFRVDATQWATSPRYDTTLCGPLFFVDRLPFTPRLPSWLRFGRI